VLVDKVYQNVLASAMVCPGDLTPRYWRWLVQMLAAGQYNMLAEEKEKPSSVFVDRPTMFLDCPHAFDDVSQSKLLLAR
jgi:hypothetical protein